MPELTVTSVRSAISIAQAGGTPDGVEVEGVGKKTADYKTGKAETLKAEMPQIALKFSARMGNRRKKQK